MKKRHGNAHPLLKRARAYKALMMRTDLSFDHYWRAGEQCLAEYHRQKNARALRAKTEKEWRKKWEQRKKERENV